MRSRSHPQSRLFVLALALMSALAACGGANSAESEPTASSESSTNLTQNSTAESGATLGWVITGPDGSEFEFNKSYPVVRGLVVTRPELLDGVATALAW